MCARAEHNNTQERPHVRLRCVFARAEHNNTQEPSPCAFGEELNRLSTRSGHVM